MKQVLNYNITIQADFILITNGTDNYGFALQNGTAEQISELPGY
jgi:hypothetical protein